MKKTVLVVFLSLASMANAQQYTAGTRYDNYHDIVPDSLLWYQVYPSVYKTYSLNVFGTENPELVFTSMGSISSSGSAQVIKVQSINQDIYVRFGRWDSVWVPGNNAWSVTRVAAALNEGDVINASGAVWTKDEQFMINLSGSQGGNHQVRDFVGGDKFLGLKYLEQGQYDITEHYGWVWIRCISDDSCYVKEYSSARLVAGVGEQAGKNIRLYPNPSSGYFFIEGVNENSVDPLSIRISDIAGRAVRFTTNQSGDDLRVNFLDSPAGVFLVTYEAAGLPVSRKILKSN